MPRLEEIGKKWSQFIEVPSLPWLNRALNGGFVRGAVYLLAGGPGLGKTTLVNQVLGDLASRGRKVLYVSTEQTLGEFKAALERVHARGGTLPPTIAKNFYADDTVDDVDGLPKFLTRKVLTAGEEYHGVEVIAIDSVQGRGLSSNSTRKYTALYEFANMARAQGLVTIVVGHVTKNGAIAGPKNFEHNVDCILYLRRAFRLRPFFIQKNRFGPDVVEPVVLIMDERGCLVKSPLSAAKRTTVYGFGGVGDELTEAQASVSLPRLGYRAELIAPFLPDKKIRQLLGVLSTLQEIDLSDLNYLINCYLPRKQRYREELDLPLSVALLSSYLQQPVPANTLFAGELDLTTRIRPPEQAYIRNLAALLLGSNAGNIRKVFVAKGAATQLSRFQVEKDGPRLGEAIEVRGVIDLEDVLAQLWPDLVTDQESPPTELAG
jgi:DNA repair protein RadA/Sms